MRNKESRRSIHLDRHLAPSRPIDFARHVAGIIRREKDKDGSLFYRPRRALERT
jgi:hypothetical protein